MYFPNVFRKSYLPVVSGGNLTLAGAGVNTSQLTAGQLGVFNANTFGSLTTAGNVPFILAQGSYFPQDKIGPVHGGYKESIKSKVINPRYISRVIRVAGKTAQSQVVEVSLKDLFQDQTYRLRVDLKGSPVLRFLNHQLYHTLDAYTGCAASTGATRVDPTTVAITYAKQVNEDPFLSQFVRASVVNTAAATVTNLDAYTPIASPTTASTAKLVLTVNYSDTTFGNGTFTPTDFYELEPIFIYVSAVDESGDPCATLPGITVAETQAVRQASGIGETVLRDMILSGRYQQLVFPDSSRVDDLRKREIEADPALQTINRAGIYDQVMILHNVPRFNNPSSTFDNDQYLLVVHVPAGTNVTALTTFVINSANAAQGAGSVVLEQF